VERILAGEGGLDKDLADASATVRGLFNALDMPSTLKAVGVDRSHFDALAVNSLDDVCTAANPVPLKKEDILEILESVAE
jgi:alcohol dehydrogenase class IV